MRLGKSLIAVIVTAVVVVLAAVTGAVVWSSANGTVDGQKPNIIYFLADDLSADLLPYMKTVSGLADGGTTFNDYYVDNSLCCPSRASMFTGKYPHNDGVLSNTKADHGGYPYFKDQEDDTYAKAIHDTGDYRTGYFGKYLNEYPMTKDYKVPPGWDEWDVANGGGYTESRYKLSHYVAGKSKSIGDGNGRYLVDLLGDRAAKFVKRSQGSDKSFFLQVAPFSTHSKVKGKGPRFPPAPRDRPSKRHPDGDCGKADCADLDEAKQPAFDEDTGDKPSWVRDEPLTGQEVQAVRDDFRNRVRMAQSLDEMVHKVIGSLSDSERDNTYIMFGSDNGFHLGQHRLLRGKESPYDTDIRVPFIVARPSSGGNKSLSVDQIVQNVDIYPTLVDMANGDDAGPTNRDGRSMLGLINGEHPDDWRDAALVEHYKPDPKHRADDPDNDRGNATPPTYDALRTADQLLVHYRGVSTLEYYDLASDPHEENNQPDDPHGPGLDKALSALASCGKHGHPSCWDAAHLPHS
ncbi:MAG TPA: sulfatase [Stackebrandtia sp.]|uniref:sulfatase family protein n=1 Tax=Stackebrandtia sp. TaxID=2023065 RepID=UPI002D71D9E7|nr:sulfatase [Stackebrandtia sp.]HZE40149.1 sulfatase [Stackebrandtia sp.]